MRIQGKAVKFWNNVDTDVILPGKYLVLTDPLELAKHALEGLDKRFPETAKEGVILIGGKNFGCGSSREQAPLALKHAGVKCILAESFARIFFRNAINIGLPVSESKGVSTVVNDNDEIVVDFDSGEMLDLTTGEGLHVTRLPTFIQEILNDGGLIENLRRRMKKQ